MIPLAEKAKAGGKKANPVYTDEFKMQAITLAETYGSLGRAAKELDIPKSTLSRWCNGQHADDAIVLAAKQVSAETKRSLAETTGKLAGRLLEEIEQGLDAGAYSSYEKVVMFGIVGDKHALFKKVGQMDEALNVQVIWPTVTPMSPEQIEIERARVRAEYEAKQLEVENES